MGRRNSRGSEIVPETSKTTARIRSRSNAGLVAGVFVFLIRPGSPPFVETTAKKPEGTPRFHGAVRHRPRGPAVRRGRNSPPRRSGNPVGSSTIRASDERRPNKPNKAGECNTTPTPEATERAGAEQQ